MLKIKFADKSAIKSKLSSCLYLSICHQLFLPHTSCQCATTFYFYFPCPYLAVLSTSALPLSLNPPEIISCHCHSYCHFSIHFKPLQVNLIHTGKTNPIRLGAN